MRREQKSNCKDWMCIWKGLEKENEKKTSILCWKLCNSGRIFLSFIWMHVHVGCAMDNMMAPRGLSREGSWPSAVSPPTRLQCRFLCRQKTLNWQVPRRVGWWAGLRRALQGHRGPGGHRDYLRKKGGGRELERGEEANGAHDGQMWPPSSPVIPIQEAVQFSQWGRGPL